MREIKFRVWDWGGRKNVGVIGCGRMRFVDHLSWGEMDRPEALSEINEEMLDWFSPLMQFTGLLDKNGKEIYEGDVLQISEAAWRDEDGKDAYAGNTRNRAVKWNSGMFVPDGEAMALSQYEPEDIEVIGNIYENPELISR